MMTRWSQTIPLRKPRPGTGALRAECAQPESMVTQFPLRAADAEQAARWQAARHPRPHRPEGEGGRGVERACAQAPSRLRRLEGFTQLKPEEPAMIMGYRPSREESEEVIRQLAATYPKCFFEDPKLRQPLKKTIITDLQKD